MGKRVVVYVILRKIAHIDATRTHLYFRVTFLLLFFFFDVTHINCELPRPSFFNSDTEHTSSLYNISSTFLFSFERPNEAVSSSTYSSIIYRYVAKILQEQQLDDFTNSFLFPNQEQHPPLRILLLRVLSHETTLAPFARIKL